jgi:hypothetical protein
MQLNSPKITQEKIKQQIQQGKDSDARFRKLLATRIGNTTTYNKAWEDLNKINPLHLPTHNSEEVNNK